MSKDYATIIAGISEKTKALRADIPEVMQGFDAMAKAASKPGLLDAKVKEFIALAIGVSTRCDGCIGFHAKALVRLGATRAEVEEVLGMAVYMGGGPSLMYAADALRAYEQFSASASAAA
jgi:AhpD family alkylhydroperoxidase